MKTFWGVTQKVLLMLVIFYGIVWSYIYLGIMYAEHREQKIYMAVRSCAGSYGETQKTCLENIKKYTVHANPFFYPIVH